jgi:hypothetical protein
MNASATTIEVPRDAPGRRRTSASAPLHSDRYRFTAAVVVGLGIVSVPYLWVLWDQWSGSADLFRYVSPANFYDLQARAMFAGHLYVPNGSLGIEAFVHHGRQYTYFGLFPSLIRMPVLALTHRLDGRLTAPSLLAAWVVTGVFSSMLLWRIRVMGRGQAALGRAEAVSCGVLAASISGGSVLMYLAASPRVSHEDLAWSVALTLASLFALVGVIERPGRWRVLGAGIAILLTALNRSPTGYACCVGAVLVAGWFAFGRGGKANRRWAVPVLAAGIVPLAVSGIVNWAKLGAPFGLSEADQVWTHVNAHRRLYLAANSGNAFGLRFLPSTLNAYLRPGGIHLGSLFPYVSLPTAPAAAVGSVILDQTYPTASIPASMPLQFLLACWGVVIACLPKMMGRTGPIRLLLIAMAAAPGAVLLFGYINDRYLADFLPFLALGAMVGLLDVWRRLEGRSRLLRRWVVAVTVALGIIAVWANVGAAVTPTALWTASQAKAFLMLQNSVPGPGLSSVLRRGGSLPYWAPAGTVFAATGCSGLYVSTGFTYKNVPGQQLQHQTWLPVEQSEGINHVLTVTFNQPVTAASPPVTLLTYGRASVVVVPVGPGQVRLQVENAGAPAVTWPPSRTGPLRVSRHTRYRVSVMTDPNLDSIMVSGMGGGIEHYLAGAGPAVATDTGQATAVPAVSVTGSAVPARMTLCRSLERSGRA